MDKWQGKAWAAATFFLIALIILGGLVFFLHQGGCPPEEIVLTTPEPERKITVFIDGAVTKPGWYDLQENASLEDALQAAGGASEEADLSRIKITVPRIGETTSPPQSQKININTAPPKLLETLPGIGPKRAEDIVAYRKQNGRFSTTDELIKVKGIGPVTYKNVKDYITVGD